VTVLPGESIQAAIDQAPEGAVICLTEGTWEENIEIKKTLALRGSGIAQTTIKGKEVGKPVIYIVSPGTEAIVEELTIAEAKIGTLGLVTAQEDGVFVPPGPTKVTLKGVQISGNGDDGLEVQGRAQVRIENSIIEGNGAGQVCAAAPQTCNGIEVGMESQVTLINSTIEENADWGIMAWLVKCGWSANWFFGKLDFQWVSIVGNNTLGNLDGMGNPGDHPWNRPEVPDGQVCLP